MKIFLLFIFNGSFPVVYLRLLKTIVYIYSIDVVTCITCKPAY